MWAPSLSYTVLFLFHRLVPAAQSFVFLENSGFSEIEIDMFTKMDNFYKIKVHGFLWNSQH